MSEVQTSCSSFAPKRALFGCRAIHDVKATDMGLSKVRFKAEVDFDGRVVTRSYLEKQDIDQILNVGFFSLFPWIFSCLTSLHMKEVALDGEKTSALIQLLYFFD